MAAHRLVPILPCNDLDASVAFYARLGFGVVGALEGYRLLEDEAGAQLHLSNSPPGWVVPERNPCGLYLYADDVDALAERVRNLIIEPGAPHDKPWGMYEFALSDPDGTLVRVGRRMR